MIILKNNLEERYDIMEMEDATGIILDLETDEVHVFNAIAWLVWNLIETNITFTDLMKKLNQLVDCSNENQATIESNIIEVLKSMERKNLIKIIATANEG